MKTIHLIAAAIAALTIQPSFAAPTTPMAMQDHGAQMHAMMGKAEKAMTPAERNKLMAENMGMMKVHMADMNAMMNEKPMAMPTAMPKPMLMPMDAAHMEKMHMHMAMMLQMMESLMVQQQLLMKSGK